MKIKLLKCNGIVFKRGLDVLGLKAAVSTVVSDLNVVDSTIALL